MADSFRGAGSPAIAVHSGEASAPRAHSLERLKDGELDTFFVVDMCNEGVDLPNVDTIFMLRTTESRVLWLQQFARGLRFQGGKTRRVILYIRACYDLQRRRIMSGYQSSGMYQAQLALTRMAR